MTLCLLFQAEVTYSKSTEYTGYFGVFPNISLIRLEQIFSPIIQKINHTTQLKERFTSSSSYEKFMVRLANEDFDFAFIQPFDYVNIARFHSYTPMLSKNERLKALIVVNNESNIQSTRQLNNKTIGMPPRVSAVSKLTIDMLNNVHSSNVKYQYFKVHSDCLSAVKTGRVDACATAAPALFQFVKNRGGVFRTVVESESIPHILFVAHSRVPVEVVEQVKDIILSTDFSGSFLAPPETKSAFVEANARDYNSVLLIQNALNSQNELDTQHENVDEILRFGVFPHLEYEQFERIYSAMKDEVSVAIDKEVRLITSSSIDRFRSKLYNNEFDLALVNPVMFVTMVDKFGYIPLAHRDIKLSSVLVVRGDSSVSSIEDLKGRVLGTPGHFSIVSRLMDLKLKESDMSLEDFRIESLRAPYSCVYLLRVGSVDACVLASPLLNILQRQIDFPIREIVRTKEVPTATYIVKNFQDKKLINSLKEFFLERDNFVAPNSMEFNTVREMIKEK